MRAFGLLAVVVAAGSRLHGPAVCTADLSAIEGSARCVYTEYYDPQRIYYATSNELTNRPRDRHLHIPTASVSIGEDNVGGR